MISVAMSSLRRAIFLPASNNIIVQRNLSMACAQSVHKLNDILEEYRAKNYTQTYPKRFRKDVVKAATINSRLLNVPAVSAEGIEHVLQNIGMGHRMSRSEIDGIISEVGTCPIDDDAVEVSCVISSDQMLDLISKNWEDHHHWLNQPRP
jgi:hypothetical protein